MKEYADVIKSCHDIKNNDLKGVSTREFKEACKLRKKDWINKDGTVNEAIKTRYDELEGASAKISSCLGSSAERARLVELRQISRKFEDKSPNGKKRMKRSAKENDREVCLIFFLSFL